jgi:hypothetical protein
VLLADEPVVSHTRDTGRGPRGASPVEADARLNVPGVG